MTDFPKAPPEKDESRYIACQMAVETVLQDLVEDAMRRGWEETEVLSAITEVADNLMLAADANRDLDLLLAALRTNMPPPNIAGYHRQGWRSRRRSVPTARDPASLC